MNGQQGIPLMNLDDGMGHVVGLVIGLIFLAAAVIAIIRIVLGPSILDRMIATDALLATIMCGVGGVVAFSGRTDLLPVMLVISMFGFVGAVGVSRYVSRADLRTTTRYRRMHSSDADTGLIGTADGVEPSVPELAMELEEARRTDPGRAAQMEGRETELEASSLQVPLREQDDPVDAAHTGAAGAEGSDSATGAGDPAVDMRESNRRHEAVADSDSQSSDADHREDESRGGEGA